MLYFELIPDEIKYVILSKINSSKQFNMVISKNLLSFNSNINFKYLMSIMYNNLYKQISNILHINTKYDFDEYNLNEEYYIYPIVFKDINYILLPYKYIPISINNILFFSSYAMNTITINLLYMILINKEWPNIYHILNHFLYDRSLIPKFYNFILDVSSININYVDDAIRDLIVESRELIKTGKIENSIKINVNLHMLYNNEINPSIIIVLLYILKDVFKIELKEVLTDSTILLIKDIVSTYENQSQTDRDLKSNYILLAEILDAID